MNFNEHCNLCDNLKTNLQDGIICGLTNQKPLFNKICSKIRIGKEFEKKIGLLHIEIEKLKKKKKSIYVSFYLNTALGCILILAGCSLVGFAITNNRFIFKIAWVMILAGFGLFGFTFTKLNAYRNKAKAAKVEKNRIDAILDKYQIKYNCIIIFGEKYHGNQDVIVEIQSKNNLLKDSKTTYQINDYLN